MVVGDLFIEVGVVIRSDQFTMTDSIIEKATTTCLVVALPLKYYNIFWVVWALNLRLWFAIYILDVYLDF